jgi:hypothetical protein
MVAVKWRKWNRLIHRDLGYLCIGLTIIYAVSGVAVNHMRDWNPNFKVTESQRNVGPVRAEDPRAPEVVGGILQQLGLDPSYRDSFRRDEATLEIFIEGGTVAVDLPTGKTVLEAVKDRRVLKEANFLHLNQPRGLWTYMADLYAVALLVLAVTGMFVIKGKKGITGRGAWLTAVGAVIPIVFLWLYL